MEKLVGQKPDYKFMRPEVSPTSQNNRVALTPHDVWNDGSAPLEVAGLRVPVPMGSRGADVAETILLVKVRLLTLNLSYMVKLQVRVILQTLVAVRQELVH
ncbi:hypothetical protein V6N11_067554 [Hibiscus sabdariffa]|uniref:Uncharacterized protein n=1 Tax=Hibiscus sabdariffa TaxID=183260 RepID=A0ABR2SR84_9ROSI